MQNDNIIEQSSKARNKTPRTAHHAIDQQLLDTLKSLGLVRYSTDFSYQCGKNPGNFRSMKRLRHGVHIGTLLLLAARYAKTVKDSEDMSERARYREALAAIKQAIDAKCSLRNAEIDARRAATAARKAAWERA